MSLNDLNFLLKGIYIAGEKVSRDETNKQGKDILAPVSLPSIVLIIQGFAVSGIPVNVRAYDSVMREQLQSSNLDNDWKASLQHVFGADDRPLSEREIEELNSSDKPVETIYMLDVKIKQGVSTINMPCSAFKFDSVQGWTFGSLQ